MATKTRPKNTIKWKKATSCSTGGNLMGLLTKDQREAANEIERLNAIFGYDVFETAMVEADEDLHRRAVKRLRTDGDLIPAEDAVGPLDKE